ncbi:MAG: hypothetical protein KKI02_12305 [Planctomycetes bacterium]|nr:hypothetical protein [Planctomycetota bacterium]
MRVLMLVACFLLSTGRPALATSLKEMYDLATPAAGYDKYIVLETGVTYTGGLWIGGTFNRITATFEEHGEDVRIVGNGAILDLQGGEICIAYCNGRLDLDDCVIINGNVRYRGYDDATLQLVPEGSVRYVTFYQPHDYGVRLYGCGAGILVERNIVVDAVDTGPDFHFLTGMPMEWLPTGANFSLSVQAGSYDVFENWSYHSDPAANADPVRHFNLLCDYG